MGDQGSVSLSCGSPDGDLRDNESDVERRNTPSCLYQYTCRGLRLWNNRKHEAAQVYNYMPKQSGPSSNLGSYGCYGIFSSGKPIQSGGETSILKIKGHGQSHQPPPPPLPPHPPHPHLPPTKKGVLNQGILHLWPQCGDPGLIERVRRYRADKLVVDTRTDKQTQATTIPEGQNWPQLKITIYADEARRYQKMKTRRHTTQVFHGLKNAYLYMHLARL